IVAVDPAVGDVFNPAFHEAISIQETPDLEPNRIVAVVQKGYMLQNRLLRAARVVVSKAPTS
ncbi:MAG: nucleotide exchange factor GrpE, partial [Ignavibacteria bacterium]